MKQLQPRADYVVLRRIEAETHTDSGIEIPEQARQAPHQAEVIATGPDVADGLAVGDRVLIGKFAGTVIEVEREEYLIVRDDEVMVRLAEE